jgi:hypothetical protein
MSDLPILQKTYDLVRWYVPIADRLPRTQRFGLEERLGRQLYDLLSELDWLERCPAMNDFLKKNFSAARPTKNCKGLKVKRVKS